MIEWLPGYEKIPITSCAGSYSPGYAWRIVLHSTESPFGSLPGIIDFFKANPCSCPHFSIDPGTGRKAQFIPITNAAAALRSGKNGIETNRACAIQTEICGRADEAEHWSDQTLDFIAGHVADIARHVPIDLNNVPTCDRSGTYAVESSKYRLQGNDWKQFDGLGDHAVVPYNDHYDVARLDRDQIAQLAKAKLGQPTEEDDMPSPQELFGWLIGEDPKKVTPEQVREVLAKDALFWVSGQRDIEAEARGDGVTGYRTNEGVVEGLHFTLSGQRRAEAEARGEKIEGSLGWRDLGHVQVGD